MTKILFICYGNICRSTMAEFFMKDLVEKRGLADRFHIASAATSTEEIGNPIYPPARREILRRGIPMDESKRAVQLRRDDYEKYDLFVGMDDANIRNMHRMLGGDPEGKIHKLLCYAGRDESVADPWYTGDFATTFDDVWEGCTALLDTLDLQ